MSDQDQPIPTAQTPAEVNIHLGYIRRDILTLATDTKEAMKKIQESVSSLDDHYVSEASFKPFSEAVQKHEGLIESLVTWKDTLNGKMIGFGLGISVATSVVTFVLSYFIKS